MPVGDLVSGRGVLIGAGDLAPVDLRPIRSRTVLSGSAILIGESLS